MSPEVLDTWFSFLLILEHSMTTLAYIALQWQRAGSPELLPQMTASDSLPSSDIMEAHTELHRLSLKHPATCRGLPPGFGAFL